MSEDCYFCNDPVNPHDISTWKQVSGWVHGPKSDGLTLRKYIGVYAHNHCIRKAVAGQAPDQPELFEESDAAIKVGQDGIDSLTGELFGE